MYEANIYPGLAALNLTAEGHTSTALRLGLLADPPSSMTGNFNLYLAGYGEDAKPAGLVYQFGKKNYCSPFFDRTNPNVVIPFIQYCGAEARMADTYYNRPPSVHITEDLEEEAQAILTDSRTPPILSTFKNFVPADQLNDPGNFLCYATDSESMESYDIGSYGEHLKRGANELGYIYPTHFVALRSSVYTKDNGGMIITPETDDPSKENLEKQPSSGWAIYMLQQNGTKSGLHHFLSYSHQLVTTVNILAALEETFITPRMEHRTFGLNSQEMTTHYGRYAESAVAILPTDKYSNN